MKPVDQTAFGFPHGNCFEASVASILELSLEECRIFPKGVDPDDENDIASKKHWWIAFYDWLKRERSMHPVYFNVDELPKGFAPQGYSIMSGDGPRGLMHSTVALGGKIIHDPHPSRAGLLRVKDYIVLLQLVCVEGR